MPDAKRNWRHDAHGAKLRREAAMGYEDNSNHRTYLFVGELRACTHTKTPNIGGSHAGQRRFFLSRRTSHTGFRRIHDDRTPNVDAAAVTSQYDCLRRETFAPRIQAELADG